MNWNRSAQGIVPSVAWTVVVLLAVAVPAWTAETSHPSSNSPSVEAPRPLLLRAVRIGEEAPASYPRPDDDAAQFTDEAPLEGSPREGGETCATPFAIGALPFNDTGDTQNNINDIESPNCEDAILESKDVVYRYTPASDQTVSISLCATSSAGAGHDDTRLLVFAGNCNPASEYACNNDSATSCSHGDANFAQAEIPALALSGGVDYYIVIDGFDGANGTYVFDMKALANGACCKVVGGLTCTNNVDALACNCLAEKWTEGGSCASPDCVADPVDLTTGNTNTMCAPNRVFGPGFEEVASTMWVIAADDGVNTSHADAFWNVTQPINTVAWWGCFSLTPGLSAPCDKLNIPWIVTFYEDTCGEPGDPIAGPFEVTPLRAGTGFVFPNLTSQIFSFTAVLPVSVSLSTAWIGVAAKVDPNNPDCVGRSLAFFTQPAAPGDGKSWQFGGAAPQFSGDQTMCLSAPSDPGACCNDQISTCTDAVLPAACPPPSRFSENGTCAALDPACGMGACCTVDGNCALTTQGGCAGTWKPGVLCSFANCPPSNDNCSLVVPAGSGLPYTFANRTNGATDDDCPALGAPSGWEAFVLADTQPGASYSCYDLVIDYCGTNPVFVGDAADFLLTACCDLDPQRAAVSASTTARVGTCCRDEPPGYDGNFSLVFNGIPAGAWYYPVFSVGGSQGDYVLNVTGGIASAANIGDVNGDGRKDLFDYAAFHGCISGPVPGPIGDACVCLIDGDGDSDVDAIDYAKFQAARTACVGCTGTAEGEAPCSGGNDGCDSEGAPVFGSISCGATVCGTLSGDDHDWYQFTVASNTTVTWTVTSEHPVDIAILDAEFGTSSCAGNVDGLNLGSAGGSGCGEPVVATSACVSAGTYWVRVAPQPGSAISCGSVYKGSLTCVAGCAAPATGACCRASAVCTPNALQSTCEAAEGKYQGNGSSCPCSPGFPTPGDECLTIDATRTIPTPTLGTPNISGSINFTRSQITSNSTDPVSNCELNSGGPFAKDGSIWFRWRSGAAVTPQRLRLDLCCQSPGEGGDSVITMFPARPNGETNNLAVACPAMIGAGSGAELACDDDSCPDVVTVGGAVLCRNGTAEGIIANRDYYFLVEIYDGDGGAEQATFTLNYSNANCNAPTCPTPPVCGVPVTCPGGAVQENEQNEANYCGEDYEDNYNSGCNPLSRIPPDPEAFSVDIACGQSVCGTAGYYNTTGGDVADRRRDTDWYRIVLTEETQVTWSVNSQTEGAHALIINVDDCENTLIVASAADLDDASDPAPGCGAQTLTATVPAGRYAMFASFIDPAPAGGTGTSNEAIDCPQPYVGTLACVRGDIMPTPANACGSGPILTGAGRYSGFFGTPVTQTPDGESTCDGALGDPGFCDGPAQEDVYWKYTAPCTGKVSFEVRSGPAPLVLSAHSACPATCDNELPGGLGFACSDFGGGAGGGLPKITVDFKAGVTYIIRFAGGGNFGPYELLVSDCVTCCDPLPSPNCPVCGNNALEGAEECDDGDNTGGDGCDAFCRIE